MRLLVALVYDLVAPILALLAVPFRLLGRERAGYLAIDLVGDLPWRASRRTLFRSRRRAREPGSVRALEEKLELAARDRRVRGVVVKVEGFEGCGAKLLRMRALFERFAAAGKQVVFYGRAVTTREYAFISCGTRVQLAPGGRVDLRGYRAELLVFGETLARAGVTAHFLRRGSHKTAPELFTDREVSAAQRETTEALLSEAFQAAVAAIAAGRSRGEDEVRRWIDEGPYTARRALEAGLVDAVGDEEELEQQLAGEGEKRALLQPIGRYEGPSAFRVRLKPLLAPRAVAVVRIDGTIKLGDSLDTPWAPKAAGSDTFARVMKRARREKRVKAIVLHIDSRGGSSLASELMLAAVRRAAGEKPVVAFVDRVAASGGYMAAVGASHIVAAPAAITGSIGVFGGKFELSGLLERLGVGKARVQLGRNAALESPFEPWTEDERAALDREIEETYQDFLAAVAAGRRLGVEQVAPLAEGRIYTGRRARELGLVDEVGDFEDAVRKAGELSGLGARPVVVALEAPARSLRALAGPKAALAALRALSTERLFAFDPGFPRIDPEP
jgi:protease-4